MDHVHSDSTLPCIKRQIEKIEARAQMMIGCSEILNKTEKFKKKQLHVHNFVHKCLHSEDIFNVFKDYFKKRRTNQKTQDKSE